MASGMRLRAASLSLASICSRTGSTCWPLRSSRTSSHARYSRILLRAMSRPSLEGTASTTALRFTRGRSGAVVSLMKRFASKLGLPDSEAALDPRTA